MNPKHRKHLAATLATAALFCSSALAIEISDERRQSLRNQISEVKWNLKHSSVASAIKGFVQDNSLDLLEIAKSELADGDFQIAHRLVEQAAKPLHEMSSDAMQGKHPNQVQNLNEKRETLASITASGLDIARSKGEPADFVSIAETALALSMAYEKEARIEAAVAEIDQAYLAVQTALARLLTGNTYYLPILPLPPDRQWSDGLHRFDERKLLTELLISEAGAEGVDPAPLYNGIAEAEKIRDQALTMAKESRYEQAVKSIEMAYAAFEESWRKAGLNW